MKVLQYEKLVVGDIILTTTKAAASFVIRKATRSDISHAMIYVDTSSIIDANLDGVQARNTQRFLFEDRSAVHVLRLKNGLKVQDARAICDYVRGRVGTQYTKGEALKTVIGGGSSWSQKQFCSRLVAQAYASVGINLVADENYCSPNDILRSPMLDEISDITRATMDADFQFEKGTDMPQRMRETTNVFLNNVRSKNSAIQNLDDVNQHLIANPNDDDYFAKALADSGYLTVWQMETDEFPWHYDLAAMETIHATADLQKYCLTILKDVGQARRRCAINAYGHDQLYANHPLKTFEALRDLHAFVLNLLHARRMIAATWLSGHAPDLLSPIVPTPHTPEWFEQMEIEEPLKAEMTKAVLSVIKRDDVCSICGDDPASDYRKAGPLLPGVLTLTFRFCDECVDGRAVLFDEKYIPLKSL